MISESRRRSQGKCVMYAMLAIMIAQASSALAGNSLNAQSQNAINPRNSSMVTPTGGKEFLLLFPLGFIGISRGQDVLNVFSESMLQQLLVYRNFSACG